MGTLAGPALVAPVEVAPPALAELPALDVNGGFDSWTALVPAGCSASWMDVYTSWCSSSAPPDGWRVRSGPAWGDILLRTWETVDGVSSPSQVRHAVALRGGCSTPQHYRYCSATALEGPAVALPAGATSLRATWAVVRRPDGVGGGTVESTAARLKVEWLGAGCAGVLGSGTVEAPAMPSAWAWVTVEGTLAVPAGTACVRPVLEADVSGRGLGLDAVELAPLM